MNLFRSTLPICAAILATCALTLSAGSPPERISYQGYLVDANGIPLGSDGTGNSLPSNYDVIFRIHNAATGGSLLWAEQQTLTVDNGYFGVLLGEGSVVGSEPRPSLAAVFTGVGADERFVAVSVRFNEGGQYTDILPRLRLLTSPYAFLSTQARAVVNADGQPIVRAEGEAVTISGSLNASTLTGSGLGLTNLSANNVVTGVLSADRVPNLNANKITAGTLDQARLPASIGGNKTFTGRVGIGTSPARPFHVSSSDMVIGRINGSHVWGSWVALGNSTAGGRYWHTVSTGSGNSEGAGKMLFGHGTSDGTTGIVLTLTPQNRVGINNSSPTAPLHVGGFANSNRSFTYYARGSNLVSGWNGTFSIGNIGNASGNVDYSIIADRRIGATEFNAFSDHRIKDVIGQSDPHADIQIIRQLRVTDYHATDRVAEGDQISKGFIAQEVRELVPEAVTFTTRFVPDIYTLPESIVYDASAESLTITLAAPHGLAKGDRVQVIAESGVLELTVASIPDTSTFSLGGCEADPGQVFIYGREVSDFHVLNYDRIFTMGISAIQELLRETDRLNARVAELERNAGSLASVEAQVAELSRRLAEEAAFRERMEARFAALEAEYAPEAVPVQAILDRQASR